MWGGRAERESEALFITVVVGPVPATNGKGPRFDKLRMPTDADDAVKQEDEITKMPLTEVEALDPAVTCKFLDAMDRDEDGGLRFKQMLRRKPMHPVVKCVFERKPHSRKELLYLSKLFLHWCAGCGKSSKQVPLRKCASCEVAYFCSEECARRALKRHHAAMCTRLKTVHDTLMPEFIAKSTPEGRQRERNNEYKRKMFWFFHYSEYALFFGAIIILLWGIYASAWDWKSKHEG